MIRIRHLVMFPQQGKCAGYTCIILAMFLKRHLKVLSDVDQWAQEKSGKDSKKFTFGGDVRKNLPSLTILNLRIWKNHSVTVSADKLSLVILPL